MKDKKVKNLQGTKIVYERISTYPPNYTDVYRYMYVGIKI